MSTRFAIAEPVARALAAREPVVALETTVVTHGLPHPEGVEAAAMCERAVEAGGAMPATIGVLEGAIRVGMSAAEIEALALPAAERAAKLNLGNLAAHLVAGGRGSTTVAATVFAAARVGIEVFATGGIGGVHRGWSESADVSVDLAAIARHPVAVVCAGAKAILDLPKTLEMLESLGVPVLGFRTHEFPAFYRRSSGLPVDRRYDEVDGLAAAVRAHFDLGLVTGVVVANPIPEGSELAEDAYDKALAAALREIEIRGVRGRDVTPVLLDRLRELTAGESVRSNLALLQSNARLAGELAQALTRHRRDRVPIA